MGGVHILCQQKLTVLVTEIPTSQCWCQPALQELADVVCMHVYRAFDPTPRNQPNLTAVMVMVRPGVSLILGAEFTDLDHLAITSRPRPRSALKVPLLSVPR
jgi:hypothetical protein